MSKLFWDERETLPPLERQRRFFSQLPAWLEQMRLKAPYLAQQLAGIDLSQIDSPQALAQVPVLRKHQLLALQQATPPFGGMAATALSQLAHVFMSPGPLYEPEGRGRDPWRTARAFYAAGVRSGDLIYNTFSYHFSPGAWIVESGARALGCPVFPAGTGQTEQQVMAMVQLQPACYVGTPSFLKLILQKADELKLNLSGLKKAVCSGEALPPSLRQWFSERGIEVLQMYASADLGLIAYESSSQSGLICDEDLWLEIVEPNGQMPLAEGDIGEVVVSVLNPDYPLLRFGTGDLSKIVAGASDCGRTHLRLAGWLGRSDQAMKVRGLFIHPPQVAHIAAAYPQLSQLKLVATGSIAADNLELWAVTAAGVSADEQLAAQLIASVRDITRLRASVRWCHPDTFGKAVAVEDQREYR